ncbi:MAG: hypothetical protein H6953_14275 [Chromatiaceae bacterium]|nr:hypothetical protein [Chromatiaceae bacterium]MCP5312159.1 hypothetical protein [Chromatiaceae bacterium]
MEAILRKVMLLSFAIVGIAVQAASAGELEQMIVREPDLRRQEAEMRVKFQKSQELWERFTRCFGGGSTPPPQECRRIIADLQRQLGEIDEAYKERERALVSIPTNRGLQSLKVENWPWTIREGADFKYVINCVPYSRQTHQPYTDPAKAIRNASNPEEFRVQMRHINNCAPNQGAYTVLRIQVVNKYTGTLVEKYEGFSEKHYRAK